MTVETLHDKFVYHLEEMYYVENRLLDVLDEIRTAVGNEEFAEALEKHRQQTEIHVNRLESVFDKIGETPQERSCPTFDALLEEREKFFEQATSDEDIRDLHDLGAVIKNEHLEIASYENLMMLARKLELSSEIRDALEDNLDDEQKTKKQLKTMADDSTVRKIFARLTG
jgi:ferritin-like metal-binding protein YciE